MKILIYLFLLAILVSCSSQTAIVKREAKAPKYSSYQYKNKLIRTLPQTLKLQEEPPVLLQPTANEAAAFSPSSAERTESAFNSSKIAEAPKFHRTFVDARDTTNRDAVERYKMATEAGSTGLTLSVLGLMLLVVAAFAGKPFLFVLAVIALLGGLGFSLAGLKGGRRRQAITGLIISGIPFLLGLVALVVYLIQR